MKHLLLCLILFPSLVFSQTEKDQKIKIRTESRTQTPPPQNPQPQTPPRYTPNYNFGTTGNYNINRWNRWGAPYIYDRYQSYYRYDRFGYGTPGRIYYKSDNTKDTILSKKNKFRLGLNVSTKNEIGGWFTVGKNVYFKAQFNKVIYNDQSTFYSNITMDMVQSWVSSNPTQNYKLDNITEGWSLYLGIGREFKNFGTNISVGFGYEKDNFQYFDGMYILSNNGKYSFKNFINNYTTLSLGITYDYKFLSVSADYDPIRNNFYLGTGFNF